MPEQPNDLFQDSVSDRAQKIADLFDQMRQGEVQLPSLSDTLYAVRMISERRLGTESMEGLQAAVDALLNEIEKRALNTTAARAREQELEQEILHAALRVRDADTDQQKISIQNDLFAYQLALHPEDALLLVNQEMQHFSTRGSSLSDNDADFSDIVIPGPVKR